MVIRNWNKEESERGKKGRIKYVEFKGAGLKQPSSFKKINKKYMIKKRGTTKNESKSRKNNKSQYKIMISTLM